MALEQSLLLFRVLSVCHAAVLATLAVLWLVLGAGSAATTLGYAALAIPLMLAIPGLARRRRYTLQWLAIYVVVYIGALVVELVASRGAWPAGIALAFAGLELVLLLSLLRRRGRAAPGVSEES